MKKKQDNDNFDSLEDYITSEAENLLENKTSNEYKKQKITLSSKKLIFLLFISVICLLPIVYKLNSNYEIIDKIDYCEYVKGNIDKHRKYHQKVYYIREDKEYESIKINEDEGEKIFCTEKEAIDNGWLHKFW